MPSLLHRIKFLPETSLPKTAHCTRACDPIHTLTAPPAGGSVAEVSVRKHRKQIEKEVTQVRTSKKLHG